MTDILKIEVPIVIVAKLTSKNCETVEGMSGLPLVWGENCTHKSTPRAKSIYAPGWIHACPHPLFVKIVGLRYDKPRLWRAEGCGQITDAGIRLGFSELTTLEEIPLPTLSVRAAARFAIYNALVCCKSDKFQKEAHEWLLASNHEFLPTDWRKLSTVLHCENLDYNWSALLAIAAVHRYHNKLPDVFEEVSRSVQHSCFYLKQEKLPLCNRDFVELMERAVADD